MIVINGEFLAVILLLIAGVIACFISFYSGVEVGRDRGRLEAYEDEEEDIKGKGGAK